MEIRRQRGLSLQRCRKHARKQRPKVRNQKQLFLVCSGQPSTSSTPFSTPATPEATAVGLFCFHQYLDRCVVLLQTVWAPDPHCSDPRRPFQKHVQVHPPCPARIPVQQGSPHFESVFEDPGRWEPVPARARRRDAGGGGGRGALSQAAATLAFRLIVFALLSVFRWCRPHVNDMKGQQLEDGRFTRRAPQPSPRGHRPSCPPLPVATGRAQPKDRTGSKKHKKSRPLSTRPTTATPLAPSTRWGTHTSCPAR